MVCFWVNGDQTRSEHDAGRYRSPFLQATVQATMTSLVIYIPNTTRTCISTSRNNVHESWPFNFVILTHDGHVLGANGTFIRS